MKAIVQPACLPVTDPGCLVDVELPDPVAAGRDLLVRVRAVSVNPVDTKVRRNVKPPADAPRVLGYDAAGVVEAVGPGVTRFRPGDAVWYAGSRARPGTNAELHRDRAHAAARRGDQQRAVLVRLAEREPEPVEQRLPRGDRRERHRRGLREVERRGLGAASPGLKRVTPGPTASTTPAAS